MTPLLFIILSNPISKSTNKNKKVKDLIRSGMRSGPGQMPVQLLNQQSSLLLTRERDFLSLLGSPLKNRSHITVVYESTMSYREPVYRLPHPKSSTSFQEGDLRNQSALL
jgi:hypothetical protein